MNTDIETIYKQAKEDYYNSGDSKLTDAEFDFLEEKLHIEKKNVGTEINNVHGTKVQHPTPVLSLSKISIMKNQDDEFQKIINWVQAKTNNKTIKLEFTPKYDGNSVNIIYEEGILKNIATRGNGKIGLDITKRLACKVPSTIPEKSIVEYRAEVIMKDSIFNSKYANSFKNSRNMIAGVLHRLDSDNDTEIINDIDVLIFEKRVDLDTWEFVFCEDKVSKRIIIDSNFLTLERIKEIFFEFQDYRNSKEYQLDGIVLKINDIEIRNSLGDNGHHPNWAMAIKFPPTEICTTVQNVSWSVGKTGDIIPLILLEPVLLEGATITKCTGHNFKYIKDNNIVPGSMVTISKRGDIIPQIEKVIWSDPNSYVKYPSHCPSCGHEIENDGIRLHCSNPECDDMLFRTLQGSISGLSIDQLGGSTIKKMFDKGIRRLHEIFFIDDLNTFLGEDHANHKKVNDEIKKIKSLPITTLIKDFGINNIGDSSATHIALKYMGIDISKEKGVRWGLINLFDDEKKKELENIIYILKNIGIEVTLPIIEKIDADAIKYEMTGSPKPYFTKKEEVTEFTKKLGWIHTDLKAGTTYLLTDSKESTSSKMKKAEKLNIKIVTYEELINGNY
jgi:DNA ligase (NAD+)